MNEVVDDDMLNLCILSLCKTSIHQQWISIKLVRQGSFNACTSFHKRKKKSKLSK